MTLVDFTWMHHAGHFWKICLIQIKIFVLPLIKHYKYWFIRNIRFFIVGKWETHYMDMGNLFVRNNVALDFIFNHDCKRLLDKLSFSQLL
jgi:hypothetical protein